MFFCISTNRIRKKLQITSKDFLEIFSALPFCADTKWPLLILIYCSLNFKHACDAIFFVGHDQIKLAFTENIFLMDELGLVALSIMI